VQRAIVGFHRDNEGEWVAELVCPDCSVVLDGSLHRPGCGFLT
jgi:hypothetical protein